MGDLISRQAAIDALRTCYDTETISMDNGDEYINYGDAVGGIEQLSSAQPELCWIPCREHMPDDYTEVLAWFEYFRYGSYNRLYQTCGIGCYSSEYDSWMINNETGWRDLKVYAWMPLPEAYREDGEQDE